MEPALIALGDVVQAIIESTLFGQKCLNVLYYQCGNLPDDAHYDVALAQLDATLESDVATGIIEPLQAVAGPELMIDNLQLQRVYPTRDYYIRYPVGVLGTYAGEAQTANLAAVITKQSSRAGRGRSGSFHIPGVPLEAVAMGNLITDYRTLMANLGDRLRVTQVSNAGNNPVWYPVLFNPTLGAGNNVSSIINTSAQTSVRVMRRRTVGVGI